MATTRLSDVIYGRAQRAITFGKDPVTGLDFVR